MSSTKETYWVDIFERKCLIVRMLTFCNLLNKLKQKTLERDSPSHEILERNVKLNVPISSIGNLSLLWTDFRVWNFLSEMVPIHAHLHWQWKRVHLLVPRRSKFTETSTPLKYVKKFISTSEPWKTICPTSSLHGNVDVIHVWSHLADVHEQDEHLHTVQSYNDNTGHLFNINTLDELISGWCCCQNSKDRWSACRPHSFVISSRNYWNFLSRNFSVHCEF